MGRDGPDQHYRGGLFLSGVRFASLPSPGLKRTQKVLARTDEYIPLAGRIAGWCRELCLSTVKPRLKALSSKLDEAVFLPPHTPSELFSLGTEPKLSNH